MCVCSLGYLACNAHAPYDMSSLACPAVRYFAPLSHKRHDSLKQVAEHEMCILILSAMFV